jgi:hypothetical protein
VAAYIGIRLGLLAGRENRREGVDEPTVALAAEDEHLNAANERLDVLGECDSER